MKWTEEHQSIREITAKFADNEINPYVDQWEEDGIFPAHELFKKLGNLAGVNKISTLVYKNIIYCLFQN